MREREAMERMRASTARAAVGHPVDVASGEQFTAAHDAEVAGVAPLVFRRVYKTSRLGARPSVLGRGWIHVFEATLTRDLDGFVFEGHDGDRVEFDDVDSSFDTVGSLLNASASMELRREDESLVVYHWHDIDEPVQKYIFDPRQGERMSLVGRVLPSGQGLTITCDRLGRVATVTQTDEQRRLYLAYDETGLLASLRLGIRARGIERSEIVARYRYNSQRELVAVYDALGAAQEYEYDAAGRLVLERDRRGGTYRMRYDAEGRCVEATGEAGYQRRQLIYESGRTTRVIDSHGYETLYQYNELGQIERKTLPNGAVHATAFDAKGRIVSEHDPLGNVTTYTYDLRGHLASKTFANGAILRYEFDQHHQIKCITDPDGAVWTFRYERGALVELVDPFGGTTRYLRTERNELVGAITSTGQEIRIHRNDDWTEEAIYDQYGLVVRRGLDVHLNPTTIEDAQGDIGSAEYDALGRLVRSRRPDGTERRLSYDAEDAIVGIVDGRGGVWRASYSSHGDCFEQTDSLTRQHHFVWDTEGRLASITNPKGEQAFFQYDATGNLVRVQHFDGSVDQANYDLAARLVRRLLPDGTELTLRRDSVGNLLAIEDGVRILRTFKYDNCGSPIAASSPDAELLFEYAVGGRLLSELQNGRRIAYEYDRRGFLVERDFEGSKAGALHLEYDARGRMRRFRAGLDEGDYHERQSSDDQSRSGQSFEYDGRDRCTRRYFGTRTEERHFDLQGRLRHQEIAGIVTRAYNYDAEGSLIELVDRLRGRKEYRYDLAEQFISIVSESHGQEIYAYDSNGNLVRRDMLGFRYATGNRLETLNGCVFERNSNGQPTRQTSSDRDDHYDWDALGQLVAVHHRDGSTTTFGYDAFGRRVFKEHRPASEKASASRADVAWKAANVRRTTYWWTGNDLLAEERECRLTEYAMWGFVAEAIWEDGVIRAVVNSQQGVPQELIDENGKLVWRGEFDVWGRLLSEQGTTTCRLRLPGQIADEETGLHYNRFRYYSPEAGQFISPDPIGFGGGPNEYRFAPNGSNWMDPLGLTCPNNACKPIPDDALVVRGGVATPEQIGKGIGPHRDVPGLTGFSAQSRPGASVAQLAATGGPGGGPFPHGQVSVTTAGQLRGIGCDVVPSPGGGANHVTVVPGPATPGQISQQFTPQPNPARSR